MLLNLINDICLKFHNHIMPDKLPDGAYTMEPMCGNLKKKYKNPSEAPQKGLWKSLRSEILWNCPFNQPTFTPSLHPPQHMPSTSHSLPLKKSICTFPSMAPYSPFKELLCFQGPDRVDKCLGRVSWVCRKGETWVLALFFQVCSPLIFYPWIAIALSLILLIFRFAHRSIALKKPVVRYWKRALKCSIARKTTAVCSYVYLLYRYIYVCT